MALGGRSTTNLCHEPGITGIVVSMRDITVQRKAEVALAATDRLYRDLVEHANDAILLADTTGFLTSVNHAAELIVGYSREELLGMSFFDLIASDDIELVRERLAARIAGGPDDSLEMKLTTRDGGHVFVDVRGRVVVEDGAPTGFQAIARDITERRELQGQLAHQALHDALTGLPNRLLFKDRVDQALARARRGQSPPVVMILDLDSFKAVNDTFAHEIGDELLRLLAPTLQAVLGPEDTVARLGGDEFGFLLEQIDTDQALVTVAERILATLDTPFPVAGDHHRIGGSLGITTGTSTATGADLLRAADTAMNRAKERNRGGYEVYDEGMRARVVRKHTVQVALADALEAGDLSLHYQPIVALDDERLLGVEALIRWRHPQWSWVQPSEFIPIAEATGLIVPLGLYVVATAARQIAAWRRLYPHALPWGIAINLSPLDLAQKRFLKTFRGALAEHGVRPHDFTVEITERTFVDEEDDRITRNLNALHQLGVRLSLDDFGTGYASLASLQRFPFATLKVDQHFIGLLTSDTPHAPMTRASVQLAHSLHMRAIAEGVETPFQVSQLRR